MFKPEAWAAEETFLVNYLNQRALAAMEFKGTTEDLEAFFFSDDRRGRQKDILKIEHDAASISITGLLTYNGPDALDIRLGIDGTGYKQMIEAADRIDANPLFIKNVTLLMFTPGGHFLGVDSVWTRFMQLRKGRKITAINAGLIASAGYYIASAAHEIHSYSEANEIGSIGIMWAGIDWSKRREKEGIEKIVIVSKNAPKKNVDISTEAGKNAIKDMANDAEDFLLDRISKGRKVEVDHIIKNFGQGGMLYSKSPVEGKPDALSVGMIDKIINISSEAGGNDSPVRINLKKEKKMDLNALLATDSEARAEFDRIIASHATALKAEFDKGKSEGKKEGRAEVVAESEKVFGFMKTDSPYAKSESIQKACVAVLKGEQPVSNVENLVSMFDMMTEKKKSDDGKKESAENGDTPGDHEQGKKIDGKVTDQESLEASANAIKNLI